MHLFHAQNSLKMGPTHFCRKRHGNFTIILYCRTAAEWRIIMQEEKISAYTMRKTKEKTEKKEIGQNVGLTRLQRLLGEALWGCAGWIFGQAGLVFDTYPLGLALLCASSGHTPAVLVGLLVTAVVNMETAAPYVCAYLAAAILRIIIAAVFDAPDVRFALPQALQKRLQERIEREAPLSDDEQKKKAKKAAHPGG